MKKKIILMLCLIIIICTLPACNSEKNYIWEKNTDGYVSYRIPGLVATKEGTLLAYCEARRTTDDWADMDVLMKRSTDGGETWSESVDLSADLPSGTRNNPVMIVDSNNKIHMIISYKYGISFDGNPGKVYYLSSEDDGVTWSDPVDITSQTESETFQHAHFACGPTHGIELKDGTLIVPFWFVAADDFTTKTECVPSQLSTFYSKDRGNTWQIGEVLEAGDNVLDPNEASIVQLSDGSVMLNIRIYSEKESCRAVAVSPNGVSNWTKIELNTDLPDPFCQGSIVSYDEETLLFSNCNSITSQTENDRKNLTIRYSNDDGITWSEGTVVYAEDCMYSDIAVYNDTIYVIYEEGYYDGLSLNLKTYKLEDIK